MSKEKSTTKICKYCQTEIPYRAKVCPQCRKKQGGVLKWVIIGFVVICIIGAAAGGKDDNEPKKVGESNISAESNNNSNNEKTANTEPVITEETNKEATFEKGEVAELNNVQVTLTDFVESYGSEYNKPADGKVFLLAEFEIANNTDKELAISSMLSFEAYADDYKLDYSLGAMIDKEGSQLDGSIAAGKKMKGWIGWEVSEDYQNVEIHFSDNVWSSNKFVFLIEK